MERVRRVDARLFKGEDRTVQRESMSCSVTYLEGG